MDLYSGQYGPVLWPVWTCTLASTDLYSGQYGPVLWPVRTCTNLYVSCRCSPCPSCGGTLLHSKNSTLLAWLSRWPVMHNQTGEHLLMSYIRLVRVCTRGITLKSGLFVCFLCNQTVMGCQSVCFWYTFFVCLITSFLNWIWKNVKFCSLTWNNVLLARLKSIAEVNDKA